MGWFERIGRRLESWVDDVVPDEIKSYLETGEEQLAAGRLEDAAHTLATAEEMRPDHYRVLYLFGLTELRRGRLDQAISLLSRAAAAREGFAEAELALGDAHVEAGQRPEAELAYRRALVARPQGAELLASVYRGLGSVYLAAGRTGKAVRELRKAAALHEDAETQALLGRAILADGGDVGAARAALEKAATGAPTPAALVALAGAYQRLGRPSDAGKALARAVELAPGDAGALAALADFELTRGDVAAAYGLLVRAIAAEPRRAELFVSMARAQRATRSPEAALVAYERALALEAPGPGNPRALAVAAEALAYAVEVGAEAAGAAGRLAARLAQERPDDPLLGVARGLAALAAGDAAAARSALAGANEPAAKVLLGRLALAEPVPVGGDERAPARAALEAARAALALSPSHAGARQLLMEALRALTGEPPTDAYAAAAWAQRFLGGAPELASFAGDAARVAQLFDRPLLLTVMGEFNSGKSTFVNSLIGEEVAPMGVVPTTATVNVLAYGRVRGGRVIYRDDRVRELSWDEVPAVLRGLDAAEVRAIRLVEVLYPAEELLRVSIVDTPGLNSILPEHEAVAREFIAQADAVIWLFSTGQAGKASERDALTAIRAAGKECLGVLNKIDRASAEERTKLVDHLRDELGDLVVDVVPYSAREALAARKSSPSPSPAPGGPIDAADASNRPALVRALEERFYSRARALKRAQAQTRLGAVLRAARADVATRQAELAADIERLHGARRNARAEVVVLERELVPAELRALEVAVGRAFRAAAREVLDFVRPRRWPLGEHNADPADRDFLIDLLEDTLGEALVAARGRVLAGLWRLFDAAGPLGDGRARDAAARLLDARVLDRFRAFLRGTLRGGRVDDFFSRTLPRLELSEDNITSALARDAGELLGELGAPLRELCVDLGHELDSRAELALATCDLARLDLDERLAAPLDAAIAALAQSPS